MTIDARPPDPRGGEAGEAGPVEAGIVEACRDLLAAGLSAAATEWGAFDLPFERFAPKAIEAASRRLARLGAPRTAHGLRDVLAHTAVADLALAAACEEGVAGAWEALVKRLSPRLVGLARKRGLADAEAATAAADVLSEMSLPAAQGASKRLIGTYEGSGSLFGWAAVVLVRRLGHARRRRGETAEDLAAPGRADLPDVRLAEPRDVLARDETTRRFAAALDEAWAALSGRERLALSCRFLDGMPQTRIAGLLHVSEPHTSRVLAGAVARLREAVQRGLRAEATEGMEGWAAVVEAVRRRMVFTSAEPPLPPESTPRPKGPR